MNAEGRPPCPLSRDKGHGGRGNGILCAPGIEEAPRVMGDRQDGDGPLAVLTTAQAVALARWTLGEGEPPEWYSAWTIDRDEDMARTILTWAPVVAAAEALADAKDQWRAAADGATQRDYSAATSARMAYDRRARATEAAVRAMRAAGGGA